MLAWSQCSDRQMQSMCGSKAANLNIGVQQSSLSALQLLLVQADQKTLHAPQSCIDADNWFVGKMPTGQMVPQMTTTPAGGGAAQLSSVLALVLLCLTTMILVK